MSIPCSKASLTEKFACRLATGLQLELDLTPKPGLVDRWNSGSHDDLDYPMLSRSVDLLAVYFQRCAQALEAGASVEHLRSLGRDSESGMFGLFGTNTHRGAIFLGGLMLAGLHRAPGDDSEATRTSIRSAARELFDVSVPVSTTGAAVRRQYRVGGVISEALHGLPAVFDVGVPAMQYGEELGLSQRDTQLLAMSRLMQTVEDTTTLRRCGEFGLRRLRHDGRLLQQMLVEGLDPIAFLIALDRDYRASRMTMGGVADLLGLTFAWHYSGGSESESASESASESESELELEIESELESESEQLGDMAC